MSKIQLEGSEIIEFSDALGKAFTRNELKKMLTRHLNETLENYEPVNGNYDDSRVELVGAANRRGWVSKLINAARSENPGNPTLYDFAQRFGIASVSTPELSQALERVVRTTNRFLDVARWRIALGEIEPRVCRIEITTNQGPIVYGTGFLVGSNMVMTNYHVMEVVILGQSNKLTDDGYSAKATSVVLRFDYKRTAAGVLNKGTEYKLALDWDIDISPDSPLDQPAPKDHLDYALLRTEGSPGTDSVSLSAGSEGKERKWLVPVSNYHFLPDTPIFILQHPQSDPLKLALDTNSVIEVENGTRVRYRTNTEAGSSGSPCFNESWELVALHHSGDPNFAPDHKPNYNEGIPFSAIVALLASRGQSLGN